MAHPRHPFTPPPLHVTMACPHAARVAAELADPARPLGPDLAAHMPTCPACRSAAASAIRKWPTDHSPSLPEWLSEPAVDPTLSEFQARAVATGRSGELELGPYLLLDKLGAGGMGEVYRGWHRLLRRDDAVKTIRPDAVASPGAVKRFLREAEAAAKLRHPNVVPVYTADRAGAGYYIAMEYVPGCDLGKHARAAGPLPVAEACEYVRQAAEGLHHAFTHGLVHRDVKPANLLLSGARGEGRGVREETGGRFSLAPNPAPLAPVVKVTDFGLARAFTPDGDNSEFTAAGAILGTADYMAPEQADDARAADTRSDIYALGCTLFSLLAGQPPFPGGSLRDKLNRHATAGAPPLSAFRADVPEAVEVVVRKCMAKRPEQRYQTPGEVAAALREVLASATLSRAGSQLLSPTVDLAPHPPAPPLPAADAVTAVLGAEETRDFPTSEPRGPVRGPAARRPWVWAVAGVVAIGIVIGLVMQFTGNPPRSDDTAREPVTPPKPDRTGTPVNTDPVPVAVGPVAKPVAGGVWRPAGTFTSTRGETVLAIGFGENGEVIAGRWGGKDDGSDSGYWEVWPAAGGKPTLSVRPKETRDWERPLGVSVGGKFVITDRLARFDPAKGFAPLPPFATDLDKWAPGEVAGDTVAVAFSADGRFMLGSVKPTVEGKNYRLVVEWETETGAVRLAPQIATKGDIVAVSVDRTGRHFAGSGVDGVVRVRDTNTLARDWATGPTDGRLTAVAITPDAGTVYAGHAAEQAIFAWDVKSGERGVRLECPWQPCPMRVSPDGRWLVAGGYGARLWDLAATPPKQVDLWDGFAGEFKAVAFTPDSKRLAVGGKMAVADAADAAGVWVWELKP